jgi:hypothetical protein
MRLIYDCGQQVSPDPVGCYVYLWRHGGVGRYVGKGIHGRWREHLKPKRNDANKLEPAAMLEHTEQHRYKLIEDLFARAGASTAG